MPRLYPREFRENVVAVARQGEEGIAQIAKDFGIAESCLRNWLAAADVDDGKFASGRQRFDIRAQRAVGPDFDAAGGASFGLFREDGRCVWTRVTSLGGFGTVGDTVVTAVPLSSRHTRGSAPIPPAQPRSSTR